MDVHHTFEDLAEDLPEPVVRRLHLVLQGLVLKVGKIATHVWLSYEVHVLRVLEDVKHAGNRRVIQLTQDLYFLFQVVHRQVGSRLGEELHNSLRPRFLLGQVNRALTSGAELLQECELFIDVLPWELRHAQARLRRHLLPRPSKKELDHLECLYLVKLAVAAEIEAPKHLVHVAKDLHGVRNSQRRAKARDEVLDGSMLEPPLAPRVGPEEPGHSVRQLALARQEFCDAAKGSARVDAALSKGACRTRNGSLDDHPRSSAGALRARSAEC
mmetsp:Transcript_41994/g.97785  ORF Transcript_41994/g.97785 Transcript_41994/m.97785 type:complete len:271 (+) Transcript_41994:1661-2473(+)